ncbi:Aluminum-activated malate transporter 1 [Carex littledalei]|uniref:Aluminum-activated malate transporter 1 n=1 Tax=Carex littledalei TaxID=544730 RepID=A0A833RL41_9POAL|nr:Aluminum-activated malate transporter 1 [Carex littledalei]
MMACEDKRKLYYSVRVSITVIIVAVTYSRVRVQLGGFSNSLVCAATTVLPTTELHVGGTLNKTIINIVANILGMLLGYGLRMFSDHEIGKAKFAFLLPVIFTLIVMGILLHFVNVVKDRYDYGTSAFLEAMLPATLHL